MTPLVAGDPQTLGPYALVGRIGVGGMGIVYQGADADGDHVAVKTIHRELASSSSVRERFSREATLARRIQSSYVVRYLDSDADDEIPWLAMEHLVGPNLQTAIIVAGGFTDARLVDLGVKLAAGLVDLHKAGVVHRDLTPNNVIMQGQDPIIIDLGIAYDAELTALTRAESPGTPLWESPEQALGWKVGPLSDIFGWAGLISFCASGRPPFPSESQQQARALIPHSTPDLTAVPEVLRPLVEDCFSKNPEFRPSAESLLARLVALNPRTSLVVSPNVEQTEVTAQAARPAESPRRDVQHAQTVCFVSVDNPRPGGVDAEIGGLGTALELFGASMLPPDDPFVWCALFDDDIIVPVSTAISRTPDMSINDPSVLAGVATWVTHASGTSLSAEDFAVERWLWLPSQGTGPGRLYRRARAAAGAMFSIAILEIDERKATQYGNQVRQAFPNHGRRWSTSHEQELERLFDGGWSLSELASEVGRTPSSACDKLAELGLVEPYYWLPDVEGE